MEYWDHWCSIWLKNNTVHGINKPWIEKTSTEDIEYLNYLNIAFGSCDEFHSCYTSCKQAEQITADDYERLDQLHYHDSNIPCGRHKTSVVKSCMISIYYRNSETFTA